MLTSFFLIDGIVIASVILFLVFKLTTKNFDYWAKRGVPFVKPVPFFGNFYKCSTYQVDIGTALQTLYNSIKVPFFGMWVFNTPHLVIKSPELVKSILVKDFNHFSDRTLACDESADSIGANLIFIMKNPRWKEARQKLTPVFTCGKLKSMFPLIKEVADNMHEYVINNCINKASVECKELCAKFSTDVLTSTAFGVNSNCFKKENSEFRQVGKNMFDFDYKKAFNSFCYFFTPNLVSSLKLTFFDQKVYDFLTKVLWEIIEERDATSFSRNDLIDIIVQMKKEKDPKTKLEIDRIVAHAIQFFAAGFETTSSTIAFTLYELSLNQDIQTKVYKEIESSLQESNGEITYENIMSMKYLHMVVSETLRKYPVLPFLDRRCVEDYKVPNSNFVITKGTPVYIPMLGLHMDETYFSEPATFDPERFSEERIKSIPPYSYIPFGEGPHNCIGARFGMLVSKYGIISLLSKFAVKKNELTPNPIKFVPKSFVVQSTVGLPMKFELRETTKM